jgi:hypothetical protein
LDQSKLLLMNMQNTHMTQQPRLPS